MVSLDNLILWDGVMRCFEPAYVDGYGNAYIEVFAAVSMRANAAARKRKLAYTEGKLDATYDMFRRYVAENDRRMDRFRLAFAALPTVLGDMVPKAAPMPPRPRPVKPPPPLPPPVPAGVPKKPPPPLPPMPLRPAP